ncbi:ArnT family glycosyltransferase, partial [Vibrio parahaemolyticus]
MSINKTHLWLLLAFALLLRLISLAAYPLMDTTEARYGEMARLMVETGNWLTPQFDYGVPFWGKPPLFTWMSAYGIELFGLNEFAVRAPHWLAGVATI